MTMRQESAAIHLHYESPQYQLLNADKYLHWLTDAVINENRALERVDFHFVSDETLLELNQRHLNHDTLTDIITFPYNYDPIEAEVYISFERVMENAVQHGSEEQDELRRVMIHGILHMCGWNDKTGKEQKQMRKREEYYLARFQGLQEE